jgi:AcrR family transcriptional regulator
LDVVPARRAFTVQAKTGERRRAATQEELLDATKRLLTAGAPLASLSVERICAEARVVRSTFYLHFRDKYDLIERLAAEQEAWIEAAGQATMVEPALTRATVGRVVDGLVSQWASNHAVLAAMIELAEYDDRMRETWHNAMHGIADVAARVFRAEWGRTGATPKHPEMVAELLAWMIERSCHQLASDASLQESIADSLAEIIWRVMHPEPMG